MWLLGLKVEISVVKIYNAGGGVCHVFLHIQNIKLSSR